MCCGNSILQKGLPFFYLHKIFYTLEYSKEIGCSEMFLITDKGNPRACHVYEKLGGKNDYKDEIVYVYDYEKGDK
ncbi:GNAT family N-acetyltransferase [Enterococcus faecium]|uniref:GNAT family N-acetyltransferase n=1 Tax=Enterococcus faecium TaxID=1352 RepID=UPI000F65CC4B|nr:GNAT family N-acetyltransferase [Enterococcus faecium]HAR2000358.1 GNAT family N-acetyltransferase [Enterococcus faecium]